MASIAFKLFFLISLLVLVLPTSMALNGGSMALNATTTMNCFNPLLQSCRNEIVTFITNNGLVVIRSACCQAILNFRRDCLSEFLTSLGITLQDFHILETYCKLIAKVPPSKLSPWSFSLTPLVLPYGGYLSPTMVQG